MEMDLVMLHLIMIFVMISYQTDFSFIFLVNAQIIIIDF